MSYNSTIKQKKCSCGKITDGKPCDKWPTRGCNGKNYNCLTEEEKQVIGTRNKLNQKNKNKRVAISRKVHVVANEVYRDDLTKWFEDRRKEMKGKCANCGGETTKNNDEYFIFSIAHILFKSKVKSIALHPLNFVELCFWGNSCHTNMDNNTLEMNKMNCWNEIVNKFHILYPLIPASEHRFIPQVLLNTL